MQQAQLDALLAEHGSWQECADYLRLELEELTDEHARQRCLSTIGQVLFVGVGDPVAAREPLENAVDVDITDKDAGDALAAVYAALGDWKARVALSLDRLEHATDPGERAAYLVDVASAYLGPVGEPDNALLVLRKAASEAPTDATVHNAVVSLASFFPDEAATLLDELAAATEQAHGAPAAADVLEQAAHARALAGRRDLAQLRYERVLALDPGRRSAMQALESIARQDGDWDSVVHLLERRALTAGADDVPAIHREIAFIASSHLASPDVERTALTHLANLAEATVEQLDRLRELEQGAGDHASERQTLTRLADRATTPAERAQRLVELARLEQDVLHEEEAARATWLRAWHADRLNPAALDAVDAQARQHSDPELLLEVLDARMQQRSGDPTRTLVGLERARLLAGPLGRHADAIAGLEALLADDPANEPALTELIPLLVSANRPRDIERAWVERARQTQLDASQRVTAYRRAAHIAETELEDLNLALIHLRAAAELEETAPALVREMVRLHEALGEGAAAMALLDALASRGSDAERIASLLDLARLQDAESSPALADTCRTILASDPDHQGGHELLLKALTAQGDTLGVVAELERRAPRERDLQTRATLLARSAELRETRLSDHTVAEVLWESALELDPTRVDARVNLAIGAANAQRWERVVALLRPMLPDGLAALDVTVQATLHAHLAESFTHLGSAADAANHWLHARALQPENTASILPSARALSAAGRHDEAAAAYEAALAAMPSDDPSRADCTHETAMAYVAAMQPARAIELWMTVLDANPSHLPTLRAVARGAAEGIPDAARVDAARALLAAEADPATKLALTLETAARLAAIGDVDAAVAAYRDAVAIDPASRAARHRLLDLFMHDERWADAVAVLEELAELETEPARAHRLVFTAAALLREQLDDPASAVERLKQILRSDPEHTDARAMLEQIYAEQDDWETLATTLRAIIQALHVVGTDGARANQIATLKQLATIYVERLDLPDEAIRAWEFITRLDPRDIEALEAIARTYPTGGKTDDDIIAQHQRLLAVKPDRLDSWHMLFATYRRRREFDRAWRTASVLRVLGADEPHEERFWDQNRPAQVTMAKGVVGPEEWGHLAHPGMDYLLTRLFAVLAQTVAPAFAQEPRVFGVNPRRDRVDLARQENLPVLATYAARVLGVSDFDIVHRPGAAGLMHANFERRTLIVGDDVLGAAPDRVQVFRVARAVILLRPELYFASVYNSVDALKTFVYGAFAVFTQQVVAAPTVEAVRACADQIQRLPDSVLQILRACVQGFLDSQVSPDVGLWLRAANFTAARAGLLLSGDLTRAVEAVHVDAAMLGRVEPADCIRDLVLYSVSESYEELRVRLRLGLGMGD